MNAAKECLSRVNLKMARIKCKRVRDGIEYVYLTHCCGETRKQIAKQYNIPTKNVNKLDSYMATFWREV